ncbi:glutamate-gated chloride channel-like [Eriocheir sinensis]|uniref:glutamate-gated chloride channel-like n=1 Tax=Eriocheir sinensis TaxID=95602 RepID=UPI0021C6C426|nr:glutamate-gated chloride channel-like [Eriocheir sinensis]
MAPAVPPACACSCCCFCYSIGVVVAILLIICCVDPASAELYRKTAHNANLNYNHNPNKHNYNGYNSPYNYGHYDGRWSTAAPTTDHRMKEKRLLDTILGNGTYDRKIRPSSRKGSKDINFTKVVINIMIRSINKIDDYHMEYSVQMTFREQWRDDRLAYKNSSIFNETAGKIKYLTLTETDKIWMPDLFFKNEKTGHFHDIILPNTYIRIYPDGDVLFSIRISLTLSCPMNLKLYPLDTQVCELLMASYGWTTEDLVFIWEKNEPIQVNENLHLPRFTLEGYVPIYCNSKTNTGEYSCLKVNLFFKREFSYYLIQYYIPCCMLVIVSWVSFWLDQYAVPARVALGVTTLLTMSTQNAGINQSLPPVSYTKAIDVWTGVCLTFVFGALLEFALVNYACRSDLQRDKMNKQQLRRRRWEPELIQGVRAEAGVSGALPSTPPPPPEDLLMQPSASASPSHRHNHHLHQYRHYYPGRCDSPEDDYQNFVRERMENGVPAFAMRPLIGVCHEGAMGAGACEVHIVRPSGRAPSGNCVKSWLSKFPTRSKRIDVIARITFPLVFALFNVAYWSAYLREEKKQL